MIDNVAVGKNIAKLRQNKNITQQQLAAALNVSHQAVSKWETGITVEQLLNDEIPEDRLGAKPVSPFDEPIQNIGNFVNNIVTGIFRPEKKDEPAEEEAPQTEPEYMEAEAAEEPQAEPAADEAFDVQKLLQMAPFMSKSAVDALLLENKAKLTAADIAQLAPYVSQACLVKLIQNTDAEISWDTLRRVAPFLKREMVDKLAKAAADGGEFVRRAVDSTGINTDDIGKALGDVSKQIGSGVEKVIRKAGKLGEDIANGVTGAVNDLADCVKGTQDRTDALRRAACERALQDEKWDWLAAHIEGIDDEELLREIAQKANAAGMHDWVLEHLNGYADTRTIDAAIESGNWSWLGDHVWQFEDELQEKIALAAARAENWQWLSTYAEQISMDNCGAEVAIAAYGAEARVLARQLAEHSLNAAQREALADTAVRAGDDGFLNDIGGLLSDEYFGRLCIARAQAKDWDGAMKFADRADRRSIEQMMELAIAEGDFDAIDRIDPLL